MDPREKRRRRGLTYPNGTTMERVMAQRSMTMHMENRTPWQDVTSICDREFRVYFMEIYAVVSK